ncbi:MAG: carboxymuconolactone decarboxylase family protein [Planctomycetaceae bacterium]|nr:carboxymuconolactone decarboxylase family protein [Planctomycetaceae bacterium]
MKKVDYADPSKFTDEQREQLDRMPINLTRMLLHCPAGMVKSFYDFAWSFRSGNLDPKIRETVILRMATLRCSQYELSHHIPAAKIAGLNDQEIAEITSPNPTGLDGKLSIMIRLAGDCANDGKISDATFASAAKIFSTAEIAEATLLAGFYEMLACFLETMSVGLDQHALNWSGVDRNLS